MFTSDYPCLPVFTSVYQWLPVFTSVYQYVVGRLRYSFSSSGIWSVFLTLPVVELVDILNVAKHDVVLVGEASWNVL